ncbi:MAG: alpha/beta hydrolase family protein [Gemmatimonadaceae bacterium]
MLRYAVVTLVALAACNEQVIEPTNVPIAPAHATAAANDDGPPEHTFGPDSVALYAYTGDDITTPTGLSCSNTSATIRECTGYLASAVDGTRLDVTLQLPLTSPQPTPLVVLIHGYAGSKTSSGEISQPLIDEGYAVLRYSTRGFGDSWGQVNLVDVSAEVGDLRSMIAQVVDQADYHLDPGAVAVTGASYGGGHSWLAALQPSFTTPNRNAVHIKTVVPIAAWSDLLYALLPNGRERHSIDHVGGAKLSYINGLYASGWRFGKNPKRQYDNYPDYFKAWHAAINAEEPNDVEPVFGGAVDGVAGYRSVWWQQPFWNTAVPARLPIFVVQGFTDDLFPLPEAKRMVLALQTVDATYPVTLYLGDIGHPRASNKTGEVNYVLGLIKSWLAYYLKGQGTLPPTQVYAALTRPRNEPFNSANVITAPTLAALSTETDSTTWKESAVLVNPLTDPASGFSWDPLILEGAQQLKPLPVPPESPLVPGSLATYKIRVKKLTKGGDLTIAGQPIVRFHAFSAAYRVQINARLFDVDVAAGTKQLVTRGTYTLESSGPGIPIGDADVSLATYGNLWRAPETHELWLELTNVDSPYITPSRIPSETTITDVKLVVPARR